VTLAKVQFTDTFEVKTRPAVVLFEEFDNVIVAGITSNLKMEGIPLTKKENRRTKIRKMRIAISSICRGFGMRRGRFNQ
jgi:hypothetical protein